MGLLLGFTENDFISPILLASLFDQRSRHMIWLRYWWTERFNRKITGRCKKIPEYRWWFSMFWSMSTISYFFKFISLCRWTSCTSRVWSSSCTCSTRRSSRPSARPTSTSASAPSSRRWTARCSSMLELDRFSDECIDWWRLCCCFLLSSSSGVAGDAARPLRTPSVPLHAAHDAEDRNARRPDQVIVFFYRVFTGFVRTWTILWRVGLRGRIPWSK